MKNKLPLFLLATIALAGQALAQENKGSNVAGQYGRPASLMSGSMEGVSDVLSFLMRRVHTIGIDAQVQEMERAGVTERKMIAVFSASGALVYHHELSGQSLSRYNDTGRNTGFQILPYTIKMDGQQNLYAAFNALSLKNMITLQGGANKIRHAAFFTVVDNIDFLMFKWDRGMTFDNLNTFTFDVVGADLKLDILNSKKETRFIALTAGGRIGSTRSELKLDSGEIIHIGGKDGEQKSGFQANYRYGLEYSEDFDKSRLNVKMGASHSYNKGGFYDSAKVADADRTNKANTATFENNKANFTSQSNTYTTNKAAYERQSLNGTVISDDSYKALTGISKPATPVAPDKVNAKVDTVVRQQIYLTPSIEFSRQLSGVDKKPVRLGVGASANIPLRDTFQGGKINMDMSNHNRSLINAKIFLNF